MSEAKKETTAVEQNTEVSAKKTLYFNKNITANITGENGLVKTNFNAGDEIPAELRKSMIAEKHAANEPPVKRDPSAPIHNVKREKLPEMSSRG